MLKESILISLLMGLLVSTPVTVREGPPRSSARLGLTDMPPMPVVARLTSLCGT